MDAVGTLLNLWEHATGETVARPQRGEPEPRFYGFMRAALAPVLPGFHGDRALRVVLEERMRRRGTKPKPGRTD